MTVTIGKEDPRSPDLAPMMQRHHDAMHADTPPGSNHMLDASGLHSPQIDFYVLRDNGTALGMGALKRLDATHAEIKSMHVLAEARGRGLARQMVVFLLDEARAMGITQISLETGAQPSFQPARTLYQAFGFNECPPFGSYAPDPASTFMTRQL
ncbi:GNAT family N-acetyltransferase [Falsirhodobacter halotolerans]|uniref:GNAT family N-acetyltransferase n=1 Tax=Falsirhodobacter halotolerans TaxID=1146892 RepID=UPI001FD29F23|nr:GNAT family N-acetyltransferase [Falsirhodobacter halotolerans]MCJ8139270.1 GNAT family N-acetyltransferase [Falsirhodobacter halotolerans]